MTLEERADADAAARVTGTERAWIDALVPDGARDGLEIRGDARLDRRRARRAHARRHAREAAVA